jgi:hypothetical protein
MIDLSPAQHFLLQACIAKTPEAREQAARRWEQEVVMEDLDFSSSRLIPYFYYQNQRDGRITAHDKRIKILYKHWWLRTQHIEHQLKAVLTAFTAAGIPTMVIKGASIVHHYPLHELRPMADFDVLVKREDFEKAYALTKELGYYSTTFPDSKSRAFQEMFLNMQHAASCTHRENDTQMDLHWRIGSRCSMGFTQDVWKNAISLPNAVHASMPSLAYEFFLIIIHAIDSGSRDNLNWIVDVALICRNSSPTIWEEARNLAVAEKKEDMFDYGCSILVQMGVEAPQPRKVRKPKTIIFLTHEERKSISFLTFFQIKIHNLSIYLDRLFPNDSIWVKGHYLFQRIQYFQLRKKEK